MTTIQKISQAANAAAERYFDMRKRVPHLADRSLAELIQGAIDEAIHRHKVASGYPEQFTERIDGESLYEWECRAISIALNQ